MITEDYCSFEVAKLLKEKGFDVYTPTRYDYDGGFHSHGDYLIGDSDISAPTHQMAMKWLREVHKLFIEIEVDVGAFTYSVVDMTNGNCVVRVCAVIGSFEDTLNTAIKDVLENLI